eukprot:scaffold18319_cov29-Prasinocladus_malaysianus.AAC.3
MAYNPPRTSRKLLTADCPPDVLARLEGASSKLATNPSLIRDLLVEEVCRRHCCCRPMPGISSINLTVTAPQQTRDSVAQILDDTDLAQAWAEGDAVAAGAQPLSRVEILPHFLAKCLILWGSDRNLDVSVLLSLNL